MQSLLPIGLCIDSVVLHHVTLGIPTCSTIFDHCNQKDNMSLIRVGLTPADSLPESLTFLHMIRRHDVYASREFRYMVDWPSRSLGDGNPNHVSSGQVQWDARGGCIHGDLMWHLVGERILAHVCVHGIRPSYHTRPRSCAQGSLCKPPHLHPLQHRCSLCRLHSPALRGLRPRRVPPRGQDRPPEEAERLCVSLTDSRDYLLRERLQRLGRQGTIQRTSG